MYVQYPKGCKYALPIAPTSDNHEDFTDCGYVLEDGIVVVDIDSLPIEKIKQYIEVFGIDTMTVWTNRGVHWYFKSPVDFKGHQADNNVLGCKVEYKHTGNTPSVTIKQYGVLRTIENEGVFAPLPEWLYPPKTKTMKHKPYTGHLNFTILYGCTKLLEEKGFFDSEYNWTRFTWAIGTLHTDGAITLPQAYQLCKLIDDGCNKTVAKLSQGLNRYTVSFGYIHKSCTDNDIEYIKLIKLED